MSLSESAYDNQQQAASPSQPLLKPVQPDTIDLLTAALRDILDIDSTQQAETLRGRERQRVVIFRGTLIKDAETAFPVVEERFHTLGYTPSMERQGEMDVILAVEGLVVGRRIKTRAWLHLLLLILTIASTIFSASMFRGGVAPGTVKCTLDANNKLVCTDVSGNTVNAILNEVQRNAPYAVPFGLTLLLILGVHEMGHYIAARRHKVDVTLPFFVPLPFISPLGTLGAVIFIRSMLKSKKALFDVGISGPLAGFVVAFIALIIGMRMPSYPDANRLITRVGTPILVEAVGKIVRPQDRNISQFITRQPVAFAAWFGMFLTALNLLPIGQLDGGHVTYTLFGRTAWTIAMVTFGGLIVLGVTVMPSFLFYAVLALLTGLRHPPPNNDITPLDNRRRLLGYATLILFFLIATPNPFPTLRGF
ncbi:MAG: site-2 protease family protein [Anaerolineae bacterium]|nr:site-2 protease family protein [Anaerolineae bacterium]